MDEHSDSAMLSSLAPALIERVPAILAEVGELLEAEHPDYPQFLAEQFDEIAAGAELFMMRLVSPAGLEGRDLVSGVELAVFEEIGRQHFLEGCEVTSLLSAYRIGARVAWRHATEAALGHGLPAEAMAALGSAVFAAVDQLSAASLRGYLREHSASASSRERYRDELGALLVSGDADAARVRAAAQRAQWPVPNEAAAMIVEPDSEVARGLLNSDGEAYLRLRQGDTLIAVVPDPNGPGRRERLRAMLRGAGTVLGLPVPVEDLATSLSVARTAVRLRRAGVLTDDPLFADEHLGTLIVHQDDRLLAALRRRYLAPLADLPEATRERMLDTLRSWLCNLGDRKAMAAELHIHPQTVRYRLRQLQDRFGDALHDPDLHGSLILALAWGPAADYEPPNRVASVR